MTSFNKLLLGSLAALLLCGGLWAQAPRVYTHWKNFTTADGLPSNRVFCLAVQGDRVWAGTENGLALYHDGVWKTYTTKDGLVEQAVSSLAVDPRTGDLWIGTFGGLSQFSGGEFHNFTQLNSGLVNNVVYAVAVQGRYIWAATAAGVSRYDTWTHAWSIFTQENAPMPDPWGYALAVSPRHVLVAMWGSGVLTYNLKGHYWKPYLNPNRAPEILLIRNQGLINNIVGSIDYNRISHTWWAGTYFGLSGYDGRNWHNYITGRSGLASNFINHVRTRGRYEWLCTARGLNRFDPATGQWLTYRRVAGHGEILRIGRHARPEGSMSTPTALAHNYIFDVAFQNHRIWVATADGISLGDQPKPFQGKE